MDACFLEILSYFSKNPFFLTIVIILVALFVLLLFTFFNNIIFYCWDIVFLVLLLFKLFFLFILSRSYSGLSKVGVEQNKCFFVNRLYLFECELFGLRLFNEFLNLDHEQSGIKKVVDLEKTSIQVIHYSAGS